MTHLDGRYRNTKTAVLKYIVSSVYLSVYVLPSVHDDHRFGFSHKRRESAGSYV